MVIEKISPYGTIHNHCNKNIISKLKKKPTNYAYYTLTIVWLYYNLAISPSS